MTMTFTAGWAQPKLGVVPVLGANATNKQTNKQKKNKTYIENNNQKRLDGAIFLTLFNETDVRNAIQKAQGLYNNAHATIKTLLTEMIG